MNKDSKLPEFKLLTIQQIIASAIDRYNKQYEKKPKSLSEKEWIPFEENKAKLNALKNPTVEDITGIIHKSWTELKCNGCHELVDEVVTITTKNRYSVSLCEKCLANMQDELL